MKVIVSAAISVDGYLNDVSSERLILSSPEDWEEVRKIRSECDAILVGAETIRKDNPSLVTHSEKFIKRRQKEGKCADPIKVTITASGNISPESNFFKKGHCQKIVYCANLINKEKYEELKKVAIVKKFDDNSITARHVIADLESRGVKSLLVEGGSSTLTMFFTENVVDEFRIAIAPFFVGEDNAPRLVHSGIFPFKKDNRMKLEKTEVLGDVAVLYFKLK